MPIENNGIGLRTTALLLLIACCTMANRCGPMQRVHLRWHLAWCVDTSPAAPQGWLLPPGTSAPKRQYRLEVEYIKAPGETPLLRRAWIDVHRQTATGIVSLTIPKTDPIATIMRKMQNTPRQAQLHQECKRLQKHTTSHHFQWRSKPSSSSSLIGLTRRVSLPQTKETYKLVFLPKRGEEKNVIALQLNDTTHRWSLRNDLPFPANASFQHLDCAPTTCLITLRYQMPDGSQFSHMTHFAPTQLAARLLHARGYKQHDGKQYAKASRNFAQAWQLDPLYTDAAYNLSCALALNKHPRRSAAVLERLFSQTMAYHKLACKDEDLRSLRIPYAPLFKHCNRKPKPRTKPKPRNPK